MELVHAKGRRGLAVPRDICDEARCLVIDQAARAGRRGHPGQQLGQIAHQRLDEITANKFDHTFRTNVYAIFDLSKAAARHMQPGSALSNTVSVKQRQAQQDLGGLCGEHGGAAQGKDSPFERPAQPCEVAPAFVLLASDQASYMYGATLAAAGGVPFL